MSQLRELTVEFGGKPIVADRWPRAIAFTRKHKRATQHKGGSRRAFAGHGSTREASERTLAGPPAWYGSDPGPIGARRVLSVDRERPVPGGPSASLGKTRRPPTVLASPGWLVRQTFRMVFRFMAVVRDLGLREEGCSTVVFTTGEPTVRVELRGERGSAPSGPPGATIISNTVEIHCEATVEKEPPPKVRSSFESLAAGRLPDGSLPPEEWPWQLAQISASGEIRGPLRGVPMSYMPQAFQDFAERIQRDLWDAATRAVGLLRWRSAELGPVQPYLSLGGVSTTVRGEGGCVRVLRGTGLRAGARPYFGPRPRGWLRVGDKMFDGGKRRDKPAWSRR